MMEDLLQQILLKLEGLSQKVDLLELGQQSLARKLDAIFSQVAELTEFGSTKTEDINALSHEVEKLVGAYRDQAAVLEKLSHRSMKQEAELNNLRAVL